MLFVGGFTVATACTGGTTAVICGAVLSGSIAGGASSMAFGAIEGGITNGTEGIIDGACNGFMTGAVFGGITSGAFAGVNILTGATSIVGNAHGAILHKIASNMEAGNMAASGRYVEIGLNKALKTMGMNGASRPDVIGIAAEGANKIVEVVSPRQSISRIGIKMTNMLDNNPGSTGKIITWVRRLYK